MFSAGAGRDMQNLTGLVQQDAVPNTLGNDHGLSGRKVNAPGRFFVFDHDGNSAREEEQEFITVRMHLAGMRWLVGHERRPDREPIDASRRTGPALQLLGLTVAPKAYGRVR